MEVTIVMEGRKYPIRWELEDEAGAVLLQSLVQYFGPGREVDG